MKKFITTASLAALSTVGLHAAGYAPGFASTDMSKPWSVALAVRGFYDDNIYTAPDSPAPGQPQKIDSFGYQISPSASVAFSTDQTQLGAKYAFGMDWYADVPDAPPGMPANDDTDLTHNFSMVLKHIFSPRYSVDVTDYFTISEDPSIFAQQGSVTVPYRTTGDNMVNRGRINFEAALTQTLGLTIGYGNTWVDYDQSGAFSYSALLDRMEHSFPIDLRYQLSQQTGVSLGYGYNMVRFSGDDLIGWTMNGTPLMSDSRDSDSHIIYGGIDHQFNPDLTAALKAGAQYSDSINIGYSAWNPYVDLSLAYRYADGCTFSLGFSQLFSTTDVLAANASTSLAWLAVNHAITKKLTGSLIGKAQYNKYNQGVYDDESDWFFLVGMNLSYAFNRHFSADLGYNLDLLQSDSAARWDYTRNRVYLGVTARY